MIRLASGLVLAAAALAAIAFLPSSLLVFVALGVALLGVREFIGIVTKTGLMATPLGAVVGGIYVGVPLAMLVGVRELTGREGVLLLLGTIVASDSAQYYSGRMLGRHLLAPSVSPKKTIEGAVGGLIAGTAVMAGVGRYVFPSTDAFALASLGLALAVLGICGDLFESWLKRRANLKDSSSLIPGHGGVLDRIDALLFATPAFYLFVRGLA